MPQQPHSHTSDCCAEIGELLSAYLDGELSAEEQQKIDIHLQSCPDCARLANALGTLRREIAETQLIPPPHLHDNIMSRVHRENKLRRLRRFTAIGSVGTAAMLCVVIMSSAIVGTMSADNSPNDNAQARYYYAADEVEMVNEHSYITVIDTTIEAALDMTATQAPTGTDDAKSDEVIISTTYSTTSYSEPADSVVGTEAPHESVQPEAADCTKSIVAAKLPENLRSLSVLDQLSVTAWKTPEAETNAADTDTLLGVSRASECPSCGAAARHPLYRGVYRRRHHRPLCIRPHRRPPPHSGEFPGRRDGRTGCNLPPRTEHPLLSHGGGPGSAPCRGRDHHTGMGCLPVSRKMRVPLRHGRNAPSLPRWRRAASISSTHKNMQAFLSKVTICQKMLAFFVHTWYNELVLARRWSKKHFPHNISEGKESQLGFILGASFRYGRTLSVGRPQKRIRPRTVFLCEDLPAEMPSTAAPANTADRLT